MSEKSEQEKIIDEAKKLHLGVEEALITELGAFLSSDSNQDELNTASLRQVTEGLLKKLAESKKTNES